MFSDAWRAEVFGATVFDADLAAAGLRSGRARVLVEPRRCHVLPRPRRTRPGSAFRSAAKATRCATLQRDHTHCVAVGYDTPYQLVRTSETAYADPATPVTVTGSVDYQAARLWQLTDGNGIVRQTLFDPLGDVLARSVFKPAAGQRPRSGDMDLRDYQVQTDATFASVLADRDRYLQGAATFHLYDRSAWLERRSPAAVMTVTGTRYMSDSHGPPRPCETEISYTDGWGRLAERLRHAEPAGDASSGGADPPGGGQDRWIRLQPPGSPPRPPARK